MLDKRFDLVVLFIALVSFGSWVSVATTLAASDDVAKPATPLSVPPSSHQEYPSQRPEWVANTPDLSGAVHVWPVTSTPCSTEALCNDSLRVQLRAALETYVETLTGDEESSGVVQIDDDWIDAHRDPTKHYLGTIKRGDEELFESATVLRFDKADQQMIKSQWHRQQVGQRIAIVSVLGASTVAMLVGLAAALSVVTRRAEQRVAPHSS